MKLVVSLFILILSFGASANSVDTKKVPSVTVESVAKFDRGDKRRQKRINKKRKRKCHQFGKKVYAG